MIALLIFATALLVVFTWVYSFRAFVVTHRAWLSTYVLRWGSYQWLLDKAGDAFEGMGDYENERYMRDVFSCVHLPPRHVDGCSCSCHRGPS